MVIDGSNKNPSNFWFDSPAYFQGPKHYDFNYSYRSYTKIEAPDMGVFADAMKYSARRNTINTVIGGVFGLAAAAIFSRGGGGGGASFDVGALLNGGGGFYGGGTTQYFGGGVPLSSAPYTFFGPWRPSFSTGNAADGGSVKKDDKDGTKTEDPGVKKTEDPGVKKTEDPGVKKTEDPGVKKTEDPDASGEGGDNGGGNGVTSATGNDLLNAVNDWYDKNGNGIKDSGEELVHTLHGTNPDAKFDVSSASSGEDAVTLANEGVSEAEFTSRYGSASDAHKETLTKAGITSYADLGTTVKVKNKDGKEIEYPKAISFEAPTSVQENGSDGTQRSQSGSTWVIVWTGKFDSSGDPIYKYSAALSTAEGGRTQTGNEPEYSVKVDHESGKIEITAEGGQGFVLKS